MLLLPTIVISELECTPALHWHILLSFGSNLYHLRKLVNNQLVNSCSLRLLTSVFQVTRLIWITVDSREQMTRNRENIFSYLCSVYFNQIQLHFEKGVKKQRFRKTNWTELKLTRFMWCKRKGKVHAVTGHPMVTQLGDH